MRTLARSLAPLFATAFLIAACDKADDKKVDDKKTVDKKADDKPADADVKQAAADVKPPAEPKPIEPGSLTLGAAKIMEKDKPEEAIEILADGTVKLSPDPEHTLELSTDGKISKVDGTVVAQVAADGSLSFDGKPSGVVLNDTGLVLTGPDGRTATVRFQDDGSVVTEPPAGDGLQLITEGCTGPMARTCGVVMTMMILNSSGDDAPPVGGPTSAPPATEMLADPPKVEPKK